MKRNLISIKNDSYWNELQRFNLKLKSKIRRKYSKKKEKGRYIANIEGALMLTETSVNKKKVSEQNKRSQVSLFITKAVIAIMQLPNNQAPLHFWTLQEERYKARVYIIRCTELYWSHKDPKPTEQRLAKLK